MNEHTATDLVLDARDREAAAAVVRTAFAFERATKRWGRERTSLSRAANGSVDNPVFRLRRWLRRARQLGVERWRVQLIVEDMATTIEQLWGSERACVRAALLEEHAADLAEDQVQPAAMLEQDPERLAAWITAAKRYSGVLTTTIAAAERELVRRRVQQVAA